MEIDVAEDRLHTEAEIDGILTEMSDDQLKMTKSILLVLIRETFITMLLVLAMNATEALSLSDLI